MKDKTEENWLNRLEIILGDETSEHAYFLREAYLYGSEKSKDRSTKNGAVLVNDKMGIVSYGTCGLLPQIKDIPERHERPNKYNYLTHAERDVIFNAAKKGIPTEGLTMYCPWFACADCGIAIISAGIKKIIGHKEIMDNSPLYWMEKIKPSFEMFEEAGVEVILFSGKIGGVKTLYNENVWEP
ncbi:MAG: deaminase [Candidatus Nanoarchaeia archaeon]|nr:deaminase [Candidatus Nanoarchaeia archaeon]